MKKLIAIFLLFSFSGWAQRDSCRFIPLRITLFNNGTLLPGDGAVWVYSVPVHPGIDVTAEYNWFSGNHYDFFQTVVLGYYYHRFSQHGIRLFTEAGIRYRGNFRVEGELRLGAGYLHAIPDVEIFELNNMGEYERAARYGRSEFILPSVSMGFQYRLKKKIVISPKIYLGLQLWMMMPFVKNYVPVLPNTALHVGLTIPFNMRRS